MSSFVLYQKILAFLFVAFTLLCCQPSNSDVETKAVKGRAYYVHIAGNDTNDGSHAHPWKSISRINSIRFLPGDTVYFESEQRFEGNILIDSGDGGITNNPVVITSRSNGKAIIDGGNGTAMAVEQSSHIRILNLDLQGNGRKMGNTKDGLLIKNSHNISVESVDIRGFQKSGLLVFVCSDIAIKNVYAADNGFAGIHIQGEYMKKSCFNILVSYCKAVNNPGDPTNLTNHSGNGILAGFCKNVVIEYSSATNNGWDMPRTGNGPVGIWCYESDSVIIQHCISYKNKTSYGAADGGGFDLDGGVTNSIIQYCLSYENEGSGFGIFQYDGASNWRNNTIRYCISKDDGNVSAAHGGVYIWNSSRDSSQFRDLFFYNNVVYNTDGAAISYAGESENAGFRFYNNIFVAKDSLVTGKETNSTYLGNNWYSLPNGFNIGGIHDFGQWANTYGKEKLNGIIVGHNIHPKFPDPGSLNIVNPAELISFTSFRLLTNSVLRTGGINIRQLTGIDPGGKDFNQNNAPEKGIGAAF